VVRQDREDNVYYFQGEIKRLIDILDRDLDKLKKSEIPKLMKELEATGAKYQHKSVSQFVKLMEAALNEGVVRTFDAWIVKEEERLNQEYARISKRFSNRANEIIDAIVTASKELFDLQLDSFAAEETISGDSQLYYMVGDPPRFFDLEGAFEFFSQKILPRTFSQSMVLRDLQKKMPEKIDKNSGRVRWDFMDRINKSFLKFRWELNLTIDATKEGIEKAIDKAMELKTASAAEVEEATKLIAAQHRQLELLKSELEALDGTIRKL
jgi:hypothetical protein